MTKPTKTELRTMLETSFSILEGPQTGLQARKLRDIHANGGSAFVAIDGDGRWHVLLPLQSGSTAVSDTRSQGIRIQPRGLVDGGREQMFLDLFCLIPRLRRMFLLIAVDILEHVNEHADVVRLALDTLEDWRELLARAAQPVSEATRLGVFGELWQLRELLRLGSSADGVWRGPDGEAHDLERAGVAIEVKTSLKRGSQVTINGIGQLGIPDSGHLALCVMVFESHENGETLLELVRSLQPLGANMENLLDGLAKLGIEPEDPTAKDTRYSLRDEHFFSITRDFPKLTSADLVSKALHPAIRKLTYSIGVDAIQPFLMTPQEVALHRARFVS